ncbi:thioviridamide family RiPP peptide [Streptomyces sp. AC550_RSS872]|uniref:thioviridamide family RiPP peptide n=1 Tax=Streptomyces sp. AC550_RSS872 TaxID=2823689 RepID=UPI001C2601E3|nr:thioviridamide family RiPP peptide [Streptomyces sp. AC550_RSS872]
MSPATTTVSEQNLDDLVAQIQAEESAADATTSDEAFSELAGVSPEELQQFLEEKVGMSPDEGVQGSFISVVVTAATHC